MMSFEARFAVQLPRMLNRLDVSYLSIFTEWGFGEHKYPCNRKCHAEK